VGAALVAAPMGLGGRQEVVVAATAAAAAGPAEAAAEAVRAEVGLG